MLNRIVSAISNVLLLAPVATARFQKANPGVPILIAGATKGIQTDSSVVERGPRWIAAYRGALIVTSEQLVAGRWKIPTATIQEAHLLKVRNGYVLTVKPADMPIFQFGLTPDPRWETALPFPVTVESGRIRYSLFSILLRVWLALSIPFFFWLALSQE